MKTRLIGKAAPAVLLVITALSSKVCAIQPDAPFLELQEKNKAKWAAQDKKIDAKLAQLEKRFGKKPNIICILASVTLGRALRV